MAPEINLDFFKALFLRCKKLEANELIFNRSSEFLLRVAHFAKQQANRSKIFFPSYFCGEVISLLKGEGCEICFYNEENICEDDLLSAKEGDLFVCVHYFGKNRNYAKYIKRMRKIGVVILEDASQCFPHQNEFLGDFIFFSPYKLLPIPRISYVRGRKSTRFVKDFFEFTIKQKRDSLLAYPRFFIWLVQRIILRLAPCCLHHKRRDQSGRCFDYSLDQLPVSQMVPSSLGPKMLRYFMRKNFAQTITARNQQLDAQVEMCRVVLVKFHFSIKKFPYAVELHFKNKEDVRDAYLLLQQKGLRPFMWPNLTEVQKESINKRQQKIFLPALPPRIIHFLAKKILERKEIDLHLKDAMDIDSLVQNFSGPLEFVQTPHYLYAQNEQEHVYSKKIFYKDNIVCTFQGKMIKRFGLKFFRVNKGPLFFSNSTFIQIQAYNEVVRFGRSLRANFISIAPRLKDGLWEREVLRKTKLKHLPIRGFKTSWLDLSHGKEQLFQTLEVKWRNQLKKAMKSNIVVEECFDLKSWDNAVESYKNYCQKMNFHGVDPKVLEKLKKLPQGQEHFVLLAKTENNIIGGIIIVSHGLSATYLASWNTQEGKRLCVHNLLLWRAIELLIEKNKRYIDLGGLDEIKVPTITRFKRGLSGREHNYIGEYFIGPYL